MNYTDRSSKYRADGESNSKKTPKMSRRDLCCVQLFGVFLFLVGLAGGILIGIYVYHGGPGAEVNCKVIVLCQLMKKIHV